MQVEADLRSIEPSAFVPYWDWTRDAKLPDPTKAPIWDVDFLGAKGSAASSHGRRNGIA